MKIKHFVRYCVYTLVVGLILGSAGMYATSAHAAASMAPPQPEYEYYKTFRGYSDSESESEREAKDKMRQFEKDQNVSCIIRYYVKSTKEVPSLIPGFPPIIMHEYLLYARCATS